MRKKYMVLVINKTHSFRVRQARGFIARLLGWHVRGNGHGVWLIPCSSIQTFTVNQWFDVIWLNKKQQVVRLDFMVAPNRILICAQAYSAIELPAGTISVFGKSINRLDIEL